MPVISITGPRQSGKTTLAKQCFPKYNYVNLENPWQRELAEKDPLKFLGSFKHGIIIDEAQHVPHLFSYIQVLSDETKKNGQFILTGSQNFLLLEKISQSLAGRVGVYHLLPFGISELKGTKYESKKYEQYLFKGFYPRLHDQKIPANDFYSSYVNTYLERDARKIVNIKDLSAFQFFLKLCAGYAGQLVNTNAIAAAVGVDHKTIRQWLSVLETSFIVFFLQPHHKNFKKRLIHTPKLYFYDVGLASYLLGVTHASQISGHHLTGALFENMIIADVMKNYLHQGKQPRLYFWRDSTGNEIDLLIEDGLTIKPVEIKSARTLNGSFFKGMNYYNKLSKGKPKNSYLVYGGDTDRNYSDFNILGWKDVDAVSSVSKKKR